LGDLAEACLLDRRRHQLGDALAAPNFEWL
jgi:hypothetical protein